MASGQLRPDIDPDMAVLHLDAVMDRFLQSCAIPALNPGGIPAGDEQIIRARATAVADYLRRGLGAHHAPQPEDIQCTS